MDKLDIGNEMRQLDRKNRNFYDELTDEERKKFSNYLMIRWGSSVNGSADLQEFYVIATNERLNKHFFTINRHPKLQWLCATTISPGLGGQRHNWISTKKKDSGGTIKKQLAELFPNMKDSDLLVMAGINSKKDLDAYMKQLGQDKTK